MQAKDIDSKPTEADIATWPEWARPLPEKPRYWHDENDSDFILRKSWCLNPRHTSAVNDATDFHNLPLRELEHQYGRGFVDGIWFVRHYLTDFPAPIAWLMRLFVLPVIIRRQEMIRP